MHAVAQTGWFVAMAGALAIAGAASALLVVRARPRGRAALLLAAAAPYLTLIALALVIYHALDAGEDLWALNRLAAAVAIPAGHDIYELFGAGQRLGWMYGPGAALAYGPVALLGAPLPAAVAADLLTFLMVLLPLGWMLLRPAVPAHAGPAARRRTFKLTAIVALALYCLWSPGLYYVSTRAHVDAPALLGGGLALLATRRYILRPTLGYLVGAAVLFALAVWTKHLMAFLLPALLLPVLGRHGWRRSVILGGAMVVATLTLGLVALAAFDDAGLGLAMFDRASRSAWWVHVSADTTLEVLGKVGWLLLLRAGEALRVLALPALALVVAIPLAGLAAPRLRVRDVLRAAGKEENLAIMPILCVLALAPFAVLARMKLGGDINSLAPLEYFALASVAQLLSRAWHLAEARGDALALARLEWLVLGASALLLLLLGHGGHEDSHMELRALPVGLLLVALAIMLLLARLRPRRALSLGLPLVLLGATPSVVHLEAHLGEQSRRLARSYLAQAARFVRAHPGQSYFLDLPLVHVMLEDRLPLSSAELHDRHVLSDEASRAQLLAPLGREPRYVAIVADQETYGYLRAAEAVEGHFPGHAAVTPPPELDRFLLHAAQQP